MKDHAVRDFSRVRGLKGMADVLIETHLKLYAGYVTQSNALQRQLAQQRPGSHEWAELKRRQGFEINGMRLHELYFEAMTPAGGEPARRLKDEMSASWGSFAAWRVEFATMGLMRGIGWVITYLDPRTSELSNHWIGMHQDGHPTGFVPVVVMDVWEHAYTGMERPAYIDAYLANVDWGTIEQRLHNAAQPQP